MHFNVQVVKKTAMLASAFVSNPSVEKYESLVVKLY